MLRTTKNSSKHLINYNWKQKKLRKRLKILLAFKPKQVKRALEGLYILQLQWAYKETVHYGNIFYAIEITLWLKWTSL